MTPQSCSLLLLTVLGTAVILALADSESCQCQLRGPDFGGRRCIDGKKPSNNPKDQIYLQHNERGLFGSCLPQVEANTMQCYRWKTRACSTGPDICEFSDRSKFNDDIMTSDQSATLLSPGYVDLENKPEQTFGHHFFCVYNVSLNCHRRARGVTIQSTYKTNWPKGPNHDCQNYLAFTTDSNSSRITHQYCGQVNYRTALESNSFLAVMWTNKYRNNGIFEFQAMCNEPRLFAPTLVTSEEGSGDEDPLTVQEN